MKEQLQRAKQALEAEPAPAPAADAAPADAAPAQAAGKTQQRAKKADDYHARHRDWVAQFNELTGGECAGGEAGVKWAAVRAWQQKHWQLNNLLADGLVGPKTLEAAKLLAKKSGPAKPEKDGAGDEKQKQAEAPEAGHADAAESSADKPKLDGEDTDAQLTPGVEARPSGTGQQTTLAEFDAAAKQLQAILAHLHPPKAEPGEKPIAQHYVEGTEDTEAPPALGAMMKTEVLQGYEAAAKQLQTSWGDLAPSARAQLLLDAVNEALAAEKVPAIIGVDLQKLSNPGKFTADSWRMRMNEMIFAASVPKNVTETASVVFHEGRHAEQRFAIARLIATKQSHDPPAKIAKAAGVPLSVATKACELRAEPLSPEQEQKAEAFKHATVDDTKRHRDIEKTAEEITAAANQAGALFHALSPADQAVASARWHELRQKAIAGLEPYFHLATERDAFAAQKQLAGANK